VTRIVSAGDAHSCTGSRATLSVPARRSCGWCASLHSVWRVPYGSSP